MTRMKYCKMCDDRLRFYYFEESKNDTCPFHNCKLNSISIKRAKLGDVHQAILKTRIVGEHGWACDWCDKKYFDTVLIADCSHSAPITLCPNCYPGWLKKKLK